MALDSAALEAVKRMYICFLLGPLSGWVVGTLPTVGAEPLDAMSIEGGPHPVVGTSDPGIAHGSLRGRSTAAEMALVRVSRCANGQGISPNGGPIHMEVP